MRNGETKIRNSNGIRMKNCDKGLGYDLNAYACRNYYYSHDLPTNTPYEKRKTFCIQKDKQIACQVKNLRHKFRVTVRFISTKRSFEQRKREWKPSEASITMIGKQEVVRFKHTGLLSKE